MAEPSFGSNHPLTVKRWIESDLKYMEQKFFFSARGMLDVSGEGNGVLFMERDELRNAKGDRIRVDLPVPLFGAGQGDDGFVEDNEEAPEYQYDDVTIHERAHAVALGGNMTNQRVLTNQRRKQRMNLNVWRTRQMEVDIIHAMTGLGNVSAGIETVNERDPSTNRIQYIGQTNAGSLTEYDDDADLSGATTSNAVFGTKVATRIAALAYEATPRFEPIRTDQGRDVYPMLITLKQAEDLLNDDDFVEAQRSMTEFKGDQSAILKGALGAWAFGDGYVIFHVANRLPQRGAGQYFHNSSDTVGVGKEVHRGLLLGANAGCLAIGQPWRLFEYYGDAGGSVTARRHPMIGTDCIYGVAKTQFKNDAGTAQEDFATFAFDTQVSRVG